MSLQRFQQDVAARLQGTEFFANVPVFIYRPRAATTAAQIEDKINAALGVLLGQNGTAGLCATVMMPVLTTQRPELPGPYLHLKCMVRVQENVMVNMGENGTQIACEDAAIAVAQALHLWTPGGTAGIIRVAPETITPEKGAEGRVTYDVTVESELELACMTRTPAPVMTVTDGAVAITCAEAGAAIYYTTDGSAPWAGSEAVASSAVLYSGVFTVEAGTMVRAAAFAEGLEGSDVVWGVV